MEDTIAKYEPRLSDLKIDVVLDQIDLDLNVDEPSQVRKQASISVEGKIKHSGTRFTFNTQLLVSPLSQ